MVTISFEEIASLGITPEQCYEWVEFGIKNKKSVLLPPKISLKPIDGMFCNVMPSIIPNLEGHMWGGVKVVTRYPERVPSLESRILLMNIENGDFLALMDGTWITALRTGAVAAHSIITLAKKNFSVIGMMGLGNTARAALLVLQAMLPEHDMTIKLLKYKNQADDFAERFKKCKNLHFEFVDTTREMVKGSDVVISGATYLPNDICEDDCFDPGVLVVPIHTLGFTNCDLFFDKVYADDYGHVHHFKNFDKFKQFAEVCDVVNGEKPGRESDEERILAYNIGLSLHDIIFAAHVYEKLLENGRIDELQQIEMKDPTDKFWV